MKNTFLCVAAGAAACVAIAGTSALGQAPLYRPTPIAETGLTINPDTYGRIGMNNLGEIVYGIGNNAFLYLPNANYDLAAGLYNLNSISDRSGVTIARAINDYGFVVGSIGDNTIPGASEAILWNLNERDENDKIVTTLLDSNDYFAWSGAMGISNDSTDPIIVGAGGVSGTCNACSDPPTEGGPSPLQRLAFALRLSDVPIDGAEILEITAENSCAWDVSEQDETVAGRFQCVTDYCPPGGTVHCDSVPNAIAWVEGDAVFLDSFGTTLSDARGTNALGEIVGS